MAKIQMPAAMITEVVGWLLEDPLLSSETDAESRKKNNRLLRGYVRYWVPSLEVWVEPNLRSRLRVLSIATKNLIHKNN